MAKNGPNCVHLVSTNRELTVHQATWLKPKFQGHLVHPQPPTFRGFQTSESPAKTPRPPYHWSCRILTHKKNPKPLEKGPFWDQKWAKNTFSQKAMADHLGCTNK